MHEQPSPAMPFSLAASRAAAVEKRAAAALSRTLFFRLCSSIFLLCCFTSCTDANTFLSAQAVQLPVSYVHYGTGLAHLCPGSSHITSADLMVINGADVRQVRVGSMETAHAALVLWA